MIVDEPLGLTTALWCAERQLYTFPIDPGSNTPLVDTWVTDASADPLRLRAWWRTWPHAHVGLALGLSTLVAVVVPPGIPRPFSDKFLPKSWVVQGPDGTRYYIYRIEDGSVPKTQVVAGTTVLGTDDWLPFPMDDRTRTRWPPIKSHAPHARPTEEVAVPFVIFPRKHY